MNEEIRRVIIDHLYDNLRGNPSRLTMLCRRLGLALVTLEDVNDELKALKDDGTLEVHSAHRSNTVFLLSRVGHEAEQLRRHNLSVGFTEDFEEEVAKHDTAIAEQLKEQGFDAADVQLIEEE